MTRKRERIRVCWSPKWDGPIKAWSQKFINQNLWRVDRIHDADDLIQDAYLTFVKVQEAYPRVVEPGHFMALFKTAMTNRMHDRARYVMLKRTIHDDTPYDVSEMFDGRIGEVTNQGYLNALLTEAPNELRAALALLASNPGALRSNEGPRENLNQKLRRLLGIDKMVLKYDFVAELLTLLNA